VEDSPMEFWAIVELMGHQRLAGRVGPSPLCPGTLIRVEVPAAGEQAGYTKLVSQSAIYAITATDEKTALAIVTYDKPQPISEWSIEKVRQKQLPDDYPDDYPGDGSNE